MNHFEQQSYYELLEVPVSASQAQILGAYTQAMETYAPDSIAVYTLVDPGQLEALHQRLAKARDVLCTLERRLEYDRQLGVTRTPEELALLRGEDLARAAAPQTPAPESSEADALELLETEVVVEDPSAARAAPVETAAPVAETAPEQVATPAVEVAPVVETAPMVDAASVVVDLTAMLEVAPVGEEPSVIVEPSAVAVTPPPPPPPEALLPEPQAGTKPVIHARPSAPARRHGGVIPPPLPARPGLRPPPARPTAESSRAVSRPPPGQPPGEASALPPAAPSAAESSPNPAPMKGRDSRTRLKTVVDISTEAEFNGELLRQVREGRNLSPHSLADRTRISVRHVENIEADRYDQLPAPVYLRGMLMSMARELGLDPLRVSRSYMALASSEDRKKR